MKVAVVGATGMVGGVMLKVLEERSRNAAGFPVDELLPVASERSAGRTIRFRGKAVPVIGMQAAIDARPDIALFSAGGGTSLEWAQYHSDGAGVGPVAQSVRCGARHRFNIPKCYWHWDESCAADGE